MQPRYVPPNARTETPPRLTEKYRPPRAWEQQPQPQQQQQQQQQQTGRGAQYSQSPQQNNYQQRPYQQHQRTGSNTRWTQPPAHRHADSTSSAVSGDSRGYGQSPPYNSAHTPQQHRRTPSSRSGRGGAAGGGGSSGHYRYASRGGSSAAGESGPYPSASPSSNTPQGRKWASVLDKAQWLCHRTRAGAARSGAGALPLPPAPVGSADTSAIPHAAPRDDFDELAILLGDIQHGFQFPLQGVSHQQIAAMLEVLCTIVGVGSPGSLFDRLERSTPNAPASDVISLDSLCSAFFHTVALCLLQQQIAFSTHQLHLLVNTVLCMLRLVRGWTKADGLRVLGYVLFENGGKVSQLHQALLHYLLPLAATRDEVDGRENSQTAQDKERSAQSMEYRRLAVNCLGNMCVKSGPKLKAHYPDIFAAVLVTFQKYVQEGRGDFRLTKMLATSLRALHHIINEAKDVHVEDIGSLLTSVRSVMTWGAPLVLPRNHIHVAPSFEEGEELPGARPSAENLHALVGAVSLIDEIPALAASSTASSMPQYMRASSINSTISVDSSGVPPAPAASEAPRVHPADQGRRWRTVTALPSDDDLRRQAHALSPFFSPTVFQHHQHSPSVDSAGVSSSYTALPASEALQSSSSSLSFLSQPSSIVPTSGRNGATPGPLVPSGSGSSGTGSAAGRGGWLSSRQRFLQSMSQPAALPTVAESDSESVVGGDAANSAAQAAAKLRMYSLQVVRSVAQCSPPKLFHQHWISFVPADPQSALSPRPFSGANLLTLVLFDPSAKVRNTAASTLAVCLEDSPLSKWVAPIPVKRPTKKAAGQAFSSMADRFADIIRALHVGLLEALRRETNGGSSGGGGSQATRAQILHCITVLVGNTPYQNMPDEQPGLLAPIARYLARKHLTPEAVLRDSQSTRHAVFCCLSAIFDTREPVPELTHLLVRQGAANSRLRRNDKDQHGANAAAASAGSVAVEPIGLAVPLSPLNKVIVDTIHTSAPSLTSDFTTISAGGDARSVTTAATTSLPPAAKGDAKPKKFVFKARQGAQMQKSAEGKAAGEVSNAAGVSTSLNTTAAPVNSSAPVVVGDGGRLNSFSGGAVPPLRVTIPNSNLDPEHVPPVSPNGRHGRRDVSPISPPSKSPRSAHSSPRQPSSQPHSPLSPPSLHSAMDHSSGAAASSVDMDIVQLLTRLALRRHKGDPTPDAFTVLAKIAHHYPNALCTHWNWSEPESQRLLEARGAPAAGEQKTADRGNGGESIAVLLLRALHDEDDYGAKLLALKVLEDWIRTDISFLNDLHLLPLDRQKHQSPFFELEGALTVHGDHLLKLFSRSLSERVVGDDTAEMSADTLAPSEGASNAAASMTSTAADNTGDDDGTVDNGSTAASVRAKILSCLSYTPESQWLRWSHNTRIRVFSLLLDAVSDTSAAVRTAACRALGVQSVYQTLGSLHPNNLPRAVDALLFLLSPDREPVLSVRVRACWALANICDNGTSATDSVDMKLPLDGTVRSFPPRAPLQKALPRDAYFKLVHETIASTMGNEKVVANAVRAVGNIARWIDLENTEGGGTLELWSRICTVLTKSLTQSKSVKSQWNACYAIGNLLSNPMLPVILNNRTTSRVLSELFQATLSAVIKCKNFKVRINAAAALASPPSLLHYGELLTLIFSTIADLLQNFEEQVVASFSEYRYKESLKTQLVFAVLHLVNLCATSGGNNTQEWTKLVTLLRQRASFLGAMIAEQRRRLSVVSSMLPRLNNATDEDEQAPQQRSITDDDLQQVQKSLESLYSDDSVALGYLVHAMQADG